MSEQERDVHVREINRVQAERDRYKKALEEILVELSYPATRVDVANAETVARKALK